MHILCTKCPTINYNTSLTLKQAFCTVKYENPSTAYSGPPPFRQGRLKKEGFANAKPYLTSSLFTITSNLKKHPYGCFFVTYSRGRKFRTL